MHDAHANAFRVPGLLLVDTRSDRKVLRLKGFGPVLLRVVIVVVAVTLSDRWRFCWAAVVVDRTGDGDSVHHYFVRDAPHTCVHPSFSNQSGTINSWTQPRLGDSGMRNDL